MAVTAIDTDDELLCVLDFAKPWAPGLPFDESDPLDWQDKQQVLKLYHFAVVIPEVPGPTARVDEELASLRRRTPATTAPSRTRSDDTQIHIRRAPEFPTLTGG